MRRMLSEEQLKKKILKYAPGGELAVTSVNGEIGDVVLKASDINANNSTSVQANLERIDLEVEANRDDIEDLKDTVEEKQDTLTAGQNISIVGNVISAVGGEIGYDAGTAIDITGTTISIDAPYIRIQRSEEDYDYGEVIGDYVNIDQSTAWGNKQDCFWKHVLSNGDEALIIISTSNAPITYNSTYHGYMIPSANIISIHYENYNDLIVKYGFPIDGDEGGHDTAITYIRAFAWITSQGTAIHELDTDFTDVVTKL